MKIRSGAEGESGEVKSGKVGRWKCAKTYLSKKFRDFEIPLFSHGKDPKVRLRNPVPHFFTFYFPTFPLFTSQSSEDGIVQELRIVMSGIIEGVMQPPALFPA